MVSCGENHLLDVVPPLDQVGRRNAGPALLVVRGPGEEPAAGGLGQSGEGRHRVGHDAPLHHHIGGPGHGRLVRYLSAAGAASDRLQTATGGGGR